MISVKFSGKFLSGIVFSVLFLQTALCDDAVTNENAEKLSAECSFSNIDACLQAASFYQSGKTKEEHKKAADLFLKACDFANPDGCYALGEYYELGIEGNPDFDKAVRLYAEACDLNHGFSCGKFAMYLADERNKTRDLKSAAELADKGCNLNNGYSCGVRAHIAASLAQKKDMELARKLFTKGCSLNDGSSCSEIGLMYVNGLFGKVDIESGLESLKKGNW